MGYQPVKTKPPRSAPPPLSRGLSRTLAFLAKKSGAMDPQLAGKWPEIVGPEIAALCRPVRLRAQGKGKALEVAVANGAAAMQLQFKQQVLLQKINGWLGKNSVSRILIRQTGKAGLAKNAGRAGGPRRTEKSAWSRPEISPAGQGLPARTHQEKAGNLDAALSRMNQLLEARNAPPGVSKR